MNIAIPMLQERTRNWIFLCIAMVAGAVDVWSIVGWTEINPRNLTWLHGDPSQYQTGWEFLRRSGIWHLPPTWVATLDFPAGLSASYLDIIPIVAVPLALASSFLPADFQYLGLYAVLSFGLQAYFGLRLAWRFSEGDVAATIFGAGFFLLSPVLTKELYGHFALLSQWMILAAIEFYFRVVRERSNAANLLPLVVLAVIACAIQPYIALMVDAVAFAAIARARTVREERAWSGTLVWTALLIASNILSLLAAGFIVPGTSQFAGGGYTHYAMNLLAPVNLQGPSLLLPSYPVVHRPTSAGYNYLGIGIIFLLGVVLVVRPKLLRVPWSPALRPLLIVSAILSLLALSIEVCFGRRVLFTVPLPAQLVNMLSAFRACGRLFWPVYYLLFVAAFAGICASIPARMARGGLLVFALVLQYFDVLPLRDGVGETAKLYPHHLMSPVWRSLPAHYRHLVILPAFQCGNTPAPDVWPEFAHLAAQGGMTLNSVYASRVSDKMRLNDCARAPALLLRQGLRADTAYVLDERLAAAIEQNPRFAQDCRRFDGFNLCSQPMRTRSGLG